jgi:hypothetical protein
MNSFGHEGIRSAWLLPLSRDYPLSARSGRNPGNLSVPTVRLGGFGEQG